MAGVSEAGLWRTDDQRFVQAFPGKFSTTYGLGGLSLGLFIVLTVTGVLLMFYYRPTVDLAYRDMKDLQADLRHNSLSTTQNTYYNSLDEQRAHSVKKMKIKMTTHKRSHCQVFLA